MQKRKETEASEGKRHTVVKISYKFTKHDAPAPFMLAFHDAVINKGCILTTYFKDLEVIAFRIINVQSRCTYAVAIMVIIKNIASHNDPLQGRETGSFEADGKQASCKIPEKYVVKPYDRLRQFKVFLKLFI